jgi:TRAP-type C4-dicarboxylate transport system substrate-binding protein
MSRRAPLLVLIIGLAALLAASVSAETPAPRYTIRWVLVHNHGEAVKQAARDFAERVERETKGDVRVQIMSRGEYSKQYKNGAPIGELALLQDVASGKIEAAQTYSNALRDYVSDILVLSLPYLLRDYAHAESVLEGPIGREFLDAFRGLPVRALAFTYSGGFGFFASNRELRTPESLRGMVLQMMRGRVSLMIAMALEFETIAGPPETFVPLAQHGMVDGLESTYSCFAGYGDDRYATVITNTEHFLLTTMIVMNGPFLDRLPSPYRKIVEQASHDSAQKERQDTIALNASLRRDLERRGIRIVELTPAEKQRFRETLSSVYDAGWISGYDRSLMRRIRETGAVEGR